MRIKLAAIVLIGLLVSGLRAQSSGSPATAPAYPESNDGLTRQFKDILAAAQARDARKVQSMMQDLVLNDPKPWFKDVFGDEKGAKLAAAYEKDAKGFPEAMAKLFLSLNNPKELSIDVVRVESGDDPNAKALQLFALAAMQNPVALYSVKISKPGTSAKIELWSLAYANGGFRWLGKMQAARD